MRFESPLWLLALIPLALLIISQIKQTFIPTIAFPDISPFKKIEHRSTKYLSRLARFLRFFILALIIITLARPQAVETQKVVQTKGIEIMMVLDTSRSMSAEDLQPENRLSVAKSTMKTFISKRNNDRIGLVVFGSDAYTQCPLTTDYRILGNLIDDIDFSIAGEGTAIGMAMATGLNRLKNSPAASKILILLTDGENNMGTIDPLQAAELAKDIGVKVYTIGVGKEGGAPVPYEHPVFGKVYSEHLTYLDEDTLKKIATITNGYYFRAVDTEALEAIYDKIDALEKTDIESKTYSQYHDYFPTLLALICALILVELLLFNVFYVVCP